MRAPLTSLERSNGRLRLAFEARRGRSILAEQYQEGSAKVRLPFRRDEPCEAVIINLGGGLTDGDRLQIDARVSAGARGLITTQAAEKIYKSRGAAARIDGSLHIASGGLLEWLPQETILFDRADLERRMTFEVEPGGVLLAVESLIFGRTAHGEAVRQGRLDDRLQIRHGGKLVWFDAWRLDGDLNAHLQAHAVAAGSPALASIYVVAKNLEPIRDRARTLFQNVPARAACSLVRGVLAFRLLAIDSRQLRASIVPILTALRAEIYGQVKPLPRVWTC